MEESSASSLEQVQEAGARSAPLHLLLLPKGARLDRVSGCWGSASPPSKDSGIKLPFHRHLSCGGWGARGTQRAPLPTPHCLSPDNGRPLLGFYASGPLPRGPAGDILPPPHSHGDSKGTDAP